MKPSARIAFIVLLTVVVIALCYYQGVRVVLSENDKGFDDAARRNPYLAAELYLKQRQITPHTIRDAEQLHKLATPEKTALLLFAATPLQGQQTPEKLWQWVEQGGHLITNVTHLTDTETGRIDDVWLNRLGVDVLSTHQHWDEQSLQRALIHTSNRDLDNCSNKDLTYVPWRDNQLLQLELSTWQYLLDKNRRAIYRAHDSEGAQVLQYQVGKGKITLLSDINMWSNARIACHDHAYFLGELVAGREVGFMQYREMPSLFTLMWRKAGLLLVLSLSLLLLWLWSRSVRLGPILPPAALARRGMLEHLQASAMFAWRHGQIATQIEQLQQVIQQRMAFHHPGFASLNVSQQWQLLAQRSQLPEQEIIRVMTKPALLKVNQLIDTVRCLQLIRNSL